MSVEQIFAATFVDVPVDPFDPAYRDDPREPLRCHDGALLVRDGRISARGSPAELTEEHPNAAVVRLPDGVVLPGFVDAHVHYPQTRVIGGLGRPLLEWLDECALPEESKFADHGYAAQVAVEFLTGLAAAGTTSALVFGSHFAGAMAEFFAAADGTGLRLAAGQVLADRGLRPELLTTPEDALAQGRELIARWHGRGLLRYAVTPRFALTASDELLAVCAELQELAPGILVTSHLNENNSEIAQVASLFPTSENYLGTYRKHGLVHRRCVLAHNVHPRTTELTALAEAKAHVAHCPTSNASLGSGLFPMRRHVTAGVNVALGSDVGAGTGFCLLKEGLQAYFVQRLLGDSGWPLTPAQLLFLATSAGAKALGIDRDAGDFSIGKQFDAIWLRPDPGSTTDTVLRHTDSPDQAIAALFTLGGPADVARSWVAGRLVHERDRTA